MTAVSGPVLVADLSASLYLGLVEGSRVLASRVRENVRGESAHGLLDECFAEAGLEPASLAAVCAGAGPGSFTGIRVGVALCQGLAFARRLPLHAFSSLAALLACAPAQAAGIIAANAGRYYCALGPSGSEALLDADAVAALSAGHPALITSGPIPDRDRFAGLFQGVHRLEDRFDFAKVAALALAAPARADGVVQPNYLMPSAAEARRARPAEGP